MVARFVTIFVLIMMTGVSFAKEEAGKLSEEDRKALEKVNLIVVMRNNARASVAGNKDGKATVTVADQSAMFQVNIDAISSTFWTVQYGESAGGGVQVNRKQVLSELFGKDMTEDLKARIERALKNIGIYPISWGGNSVIDNSFAAQAQVLLRIDLDMPAGIMVKQALQNKELHLIAEIPAAQIYEQVVLGIKPAADPSASAKFEVVNNASEHIVGLYSYDKRDDKLTNVVPRNSMLLKPGEKLQLMMPTEFCSGPEIMIVMMSDATYAESPMATVCQTGRFPDLKMAERYPITGAQTKQNWVTAFYGLHTIKFQKTEGKLENGRLTGKGWTSFHGDVHVAEFKDGFRHGTGNFCAKMDNGDIDVSLNKYNDGYPEQGYRIILQRNRMNKDPTNNFEPITFDKLYKKLCFWDY